MLNRKMMIALTLLLSIGTSSGYAEQVEDKKQNPVPNHTQTIEISVKEFHQHYQEAIPDYETGWMKGMRFSYKNQNQDTKEFWRIMHETTDHDDQYIGGLQDQAGNYLGPYNTTTKNKITTSEIIFANPIEGTKDVYAYIGFGRYKWDRNILGSGGIASDLEKYSWNYIPVGYRHEYKINDKWDGAVDISLRFMFNGKMDIPNPSYIDPTQVKLGSEPGFKIELPYTYKMDSNWSLVLTPWYEYWSIGQSNWVPQFINGVPQYDSNNNQLGLIEPASKTNRIGIDIGLQCKFQTQIFTISS